jgi:hypothetical protein
MKEVPNLFSLGAPFPDAEFIEHRLHEHPVTDIQRTEQGQCMDLHRFMQECLRNKIYNIFKFLLLANPGFNPNRG